jgi:hypothetical protein
MSVYRRAQGVEGTHKGCPYEIAGHLRSTMALRYHEYGGGAQPLAEPGATAEEVTREKR